MIQNSRLPQDDASAHLGSDHLSGVAHVLKEAEAERRRLAELLNDEPVQALAHISRALRSVEGMPGTPPVVAQAARDAGLQAAAVSEQLRRIARILRPSVLDDIGLGAALRQLTSEFAAKAGVMAESDVRTMSRGQQPEVDIALYRVAEAALKNADEHAAATAIRVRLIQRGARLILTVRDNGIGLGEKRESGSSGTGFLEMAERIRSVQGRLRVRSRVNQGTIVMASAPRAMVPDTLRTL
ncbi:MAG: ATP-binding protein [Candidatus Dormiibacterota bacterium]|jgi:signal transduction histidine kinase